MPFRLAANKWAILYSTLIWVEHFKLLHIPEPRFACLDNNCTRPQYLDIWPIQDKMRGGPDATWNITQVCQRKQRKATNDLTFKILLFIGTLTKQKRDKEKLEFKICEDLVVHLGEWRTRERAIEMGKLRWKSKESTSNT